MHQRRAEITNPNRLHTSVVNKSVATRTSQRLVRLGAVRLLDPQRAVPGEDGIGLRNRGNLFQSLLA
jgi:hypothetical protein